MRPHRGFFFNRFPQFSSSGCFLNGVTQICFFEPFFPLLSCSTDFGPFYSGFGEDSLDLGDDLNSHGPAQWEMSAISSPTNPSDDDTAEGNSSGSPGADDGMDAETLIRNADTAMDQAKENARQSYQFFKPYTERGPIMDADFDSRQGGLSQHSGNDFRANCAICRRLHDYCGN